MTEILGLPSGLGRSQTYRSFRPLPLFRVIGLEIRGYVKNAIEHSH